MSITLKCDTCTAEAIGTMEAVAHIQEYPDHVMHGTYPDGMTTRVYNHEHHPDDEYEHHPDTGCSTCDGGGCGDCR